jgi:Mg2+ and Co2+ transporter CorA
MELPIGTVHNGRNNMPFDKVNTKGDVTPEYVNKKMESMMAALFDTIEDFEDRVKVLEKQVYELKQERNGKVQE